MVRNIYNKVIGSLTAAEIRRTEQKYFNKFFHQHTASEQYVDGNNPQVVLDIHHWFWFRFRRGFFTFSDFEKALKCEFWIPHILLLPVTSSTHLGFSSLRLASCPCGSVYWNARWFIPIEFWVKRARALITCCYCFRLSAGVPGIF